MLTSFIRTVILLIFIVIAVRLMGKRQIGQLQPAELVVTILLSEIAATPMQDNDIPMLNTIAAVLVLTGLEIIISVLSLKSTGIRRLLQGNPVILIRHGVPDKKQMNRLRYTLDDLSEALRQKDVFDISDVEYAIAETDGSLSVLLRKEKQPLCSEDTGIEKKCSSVPGTVISDGRIVKNPLFEAALNSEEIKKMLRDKNMSAGDIFLMTMDKDGKTYVIRKDEGQ